MSVPFIHYFCPTCQQNAEVLRVTEPLRCPICNQVICNKCEQFGLCPRCAQWTTPEERKILGRAESKTGRGGPGVVMGCSLVMVLIFPMLILGGFLSSTPTMMAIGIIGVVGCIISIIVASKIDKKRGTNYAEAKAQIANQLRTKFQSVPAACGKCGAKNEANSQFCGVCGAKL